MRRDARYREFESHPLRQLGNLLDMHSLNKIYIIGHTRMWKRMLEYETGMAIRQARRALNIRWPISIVVVEDWHGTRPGLLLDAHATGTNLVFIATRTELWKKQSYKKIGALFRATVIHEITHCYRSIVREKKTLFQHIINEGMAHYVEMLITDTVQSYIKHIESDEILGKWWQKYHARLKDFAFDYRAQFQDFRFEEYIARLGYRIVNAYAEKHSNLPLYIFAKTKTRILERFADQLFRYRQRAKSS